MPLSAEQALLRTTLLKGLVESARRNVDAGNEDIALFEMARVYLPSGEPRPDEHWHARCIVEGGFSRAKGVVETLYEAAPRRAACRARAAGVPPSGQGGAVTGRLARRAPPSLLDGEWGVFELDLPALFERVPERIVYEDVITYPAVAAGLAFVVDEEVAGRRRRRRGSRSRGPRAPRDARLRRLPRRPDPGRKKSIALRVAFQSPERTLSDDDARGLREGIVAALADRFDAELRAWLPPPNRRRKKPCSGAGSPDGGGVPVVLEALDRVGEHIDVDPVRPDRRERARGDELLACRAGPA